MFSNGQLILIPIEKTGHKSRLVTFQMLQISETHLSNRQNISILTEHRCGEKHWNTYKSETFAQFGAEHRLNIPKRSLTIEV